MYKIVRKDKSECVVLEPGDRFIYKYVSDARSNYVVHSCISHEIGKGILAIDLSTDHDVFLESNSVFVFPIEMVEL